MADVEIQMLEQQKLIEQLKSMIRERDDAFQQKEKELQDVNAKLSKMKLQAKAKLAKEAKESKENKGAKSIDKEQKEKQESTSADKNEGEEESQGKVVRAKTVLLKKRLEESDRLVREKDETIELKDQQIEVKEKIIAEREEVIQTLTRQLEDKYKLMEELHANSSVEEASDAEARVRQMYAQIVYKDKNLLELNNKILELERKLIDLQEFIGEKNEVIRGRDKVIELLQSTIREKDQNITDQALLISKLTGKVESNDETLGHLTEAVEKAEHDLKLERDRFNLRLTESQKYFEESLQEQEQTVSKLQKALADKENELLVSENDLRELIQRHERDVQKIMTKGEVNLQDPVIQMLEQKLKDTNEVLEGKIKVIEVLQKESSQKEKEVNESREIQKSFKDKLQEMSEQMMLFQANQVDLETQWLESKRKYEERIRDLVEKHETELTEKEVQIQNLKSTVTQMEGAYNQSLSQYSVLQERYQQVSKPGNIIPFSKPESDSGGDVESEDNKDIIADLKSKMEALQIALREKEREIEELECLKQKSDSLNSMLIEMEKENQRLQHILNTKEEEMALAQRKQEESSAEPPKGDAKMLKMKAQLTAKVKSLEKEVAELKKGNKSEEIEALKKEIAAILAERDEMKLKVERMDEIQNLYESTSKKLAGLEDVCTVQETEKRDLESKKDSVLAEKSALLETIKDLQSSLDQKENVSGELKDKVKEQEKHIEEQLSVNIGLREELNASKDSLEKQMVLMEKLAAEKNNLDSEIKDYNCQIESLQQEKEKLVAQVDLLSETASGTDEKLLSYKQEIAQLTGKVTKLDEELIESCELSKKQKTEMNELLSSLVQIREEKSTLESDISTMNNKVAEHLKEIQDLQAVKDEQAVSIGVLRQELSVLKSESAVQKESLRQAGEDSNKLFDDTSKLQVKVVQLSQELQSKDQEIEAFKSETIQMTELCDGMQVRVKELICANESLNKNVKKLECDIGAFLFENCDIQDSCDLSYAKKYIDELSFCNAELKAWIRDYLTKTSDIKTSASELKSALMHIKQCYAKEVSDFKLDFKEMKELLLSYKNVSIEQEEKVSRYEKEVEKLSSDIAELSSSLKQRDLQCKQQSHEIDVLREGQTTKGDEFESRMKSLLDEISNLEHQCTDLKLENEKLITELKLKAEKCSDLDNTVHNLQLEISEVKERNGSVVKEKDNEINTIQVELQRIVDEKESLVATLTGNVESMKNELTRTESRIDEYKAEVQHLTSILDEERSDKEVLNEQLKTLENSVFAKEEEVKQLQIEFDQKCCECHQQEHAVKTLSEEVDTLKNSLIEKSVDAKDLHDSCRNLKDELSTLQDLKDGLKEQCDIYLQSLQEKETAHQQLTDDLSSLKRTHESALNDVHLELNKVFEELAQTKEMKSNSDIQLAELQRQNKQLEEEKDTLSLQIQDKSKKMDMSQVFDSQTEGSKLDDEYNKGSGNTQCVDELRNQLEEMQTQIVDVTLVLEDRENEIKQLTKENTALSRRLGGIVEHSQESVNVKPNMNVQEIESFTPETEDLNENLQAQITELNEMLQEKDRLIEELQNEMKPSYDPESDFKDFCDKLEVEKENLKAQLTIHQQMLKEKEGKIHSLIKEIEKVKENQAIIPSTNTGNTNDVGVDFVSKASDQNTDDNKEEVNLVGEEFIIASAEPTVSSAFNTSFSSISPEKDFTDHADDETSLKELKDQLKNVTVERNKFKSDNKKLIKLGKGKDTKLRIMTENFEKLREERDELLADRDSLENKVQDLSSSFIDQFEKKNADDFMAAYEKLKEKCDDKDKEIDHLKSLQNRITSSGLDDKQASEINVLSRENEKLKMEATRLEKIGKSKTATIMKINQDFDKSLKEKESEIQEKMTQIDDLESLLAAARNDVETLHQEINKMKSDYTKIQKVNKGKDAKVKKMGEVILEKDKEIHQITDDNTRLHEQLDALNSDLSVLNEKERNLQDQLQLSFEKSKDLEMKCQELNERIIEMEKTLLKKEDEISNLNNNQKLMKKLTEEKIILEFELDCAKQELEQMRSSLESEELKIQEISANVSDVIKDRDGVIAEGNVIRENLQDLSSSAADNRDESHENLDTSRMSFEELKSRVAGLLSDNKKLQQEKGKLVKLSKGKEAKVKHLENFIQEQQKVLSEKNTDILIMQENIKDINCKLEVLEEVDSDLRFRLDNALADLDEWKAHCHDLEDQIEDAHEAIDRKNEEIQNMDEDLSVAREKIDHLLLDKDDLMKEHQHLLSELGKYEKFITDKEDEVRTLRGEIEKVEKEKEYIEAEVRKLHLLVKGKDAKIKKMEKHQHEVQSDIELKLSAVSTLESNLTETVSKLHETETALNSLEQYCSNLTQQKIAVDNQYKEVLHENDQIKETVKQKDEILFHNEEQIQQYESDRMMFEQTSSAQKCYANDLKNQLIVMEKELNEQNERVNSLLETNKLLSQLNHDEAQKVASLTDLCQATEAKEKEMEIEINSYRSQIHKQEGLCQTLQENVMEKDNVILALTEQNQENANKVVDLNIKYDAELSYRLDLERKLKLYTEEQQVGREKIEESTEATKMLKLRCTALQKEFDQNLATMQQKDNNIAILRRKIIECEDKITELYSALQDNEASLNLVQGKLREAEVNIFDIESKSKSLNDEIEKKQLEISSHVETIENLQYDLAKVHKDKENETCQLKVAVSSLQEERKTQDEKLMWYEQYCSDLSARIVESETVLEEYKRVMAEKEEMIMSDKEELLSARKLIGSNSEEKNGISKFIKEQNNIISEKTNYIEKQNNEIAEKDSVIINLQYTLDNVSESKSKEVVKLQNQIENLVDQIASLEKDSLEKDLSVHQSSAETNSELKESNAAVSMVIFEEMTREKAIHQGSETQSVLQNEVNETSVLSSIEEQIMSPTPIETAESDSSLVQASKNEQQLLKLKTELNKLKQLCKGKDGKIKKLEQKLSEQPVKLEAWTEKMESQKIRELESVLLHTQEDRDKYLAQIEYLQRTVDSLKENMQTLEREKEAKNSADEIEHEQLKSICTALQIELDNNRASFKDTKSMLDAVESQFDEFKLNTKDINEFQISNINRLNEEVESLRFELKSADEKYQVTLRQFTENESLLTLKDQELQDLKTVMKEKINELEDLKKTNEALSQSGEGLESEKQRFETLLKNEKEEIQSLYEQMSQLVSEKLDLECSLEQKDRDLRTAAEELKQYATDRDNLDELIEKKDELQLECDTLTRDVSELRNRLMEKDKEMENICRTVEGKDYQINQFQEENQLLIEMKQQVDNACRSANEKEKALQENLDIVLSELNAKKAACSKLKDMCEERDALITSLKENIKSSSDVTEHYIYQISNLQEEIALYKEQLHMQTMHQNELQTFQAKYETMSKEIVVLKAENDNLTRQLNITRTSFDKTTGTPDNDMSSGGYSGSQQEPLEPEIIQDTIPLLTTVPLTDIGPTVVPTNSTKQENEFHNSGYHETESKVQKDIQTIDGPQKQLEEAQRSLEKANTAVSTLEAKLQEKDEKIKSLVENMQEMEERLSQLSDTSVTQEEPETKTTNIENEIKSLKKAVEEKELKFTKALATAKKIKIQLNESNSKLENVKREKEEIEKELINMKKVNDDVKQNTETNKTARNVDEESSVSSPHSSEIIQDLQLQLQTYAEFSQQLQDQIQELTDRIHVSEKSHKKLEEDNEILKEEKRLLENSNLEKENIVLEVNQELKENKEALRNYISMLEEKEKMNLLLQQELQHVSLSLQNLQSRSDNVDAEGMQESMKEVNKWKDDYENINKVLEKSVADMSSQMQKYTELEEQCQGYMNTIQMMQTELRTSTSEIDKLKGKLNEETETRERLEIVLKDMNEELEGTEGILTDIKTENTKLVSENSAVNDTLRAMEINVSALKNDLQKKELELAEHLDEILSLKKSNEKLEVQVGEKDMKLSHIIENLNEMSSTIQERDTELDTATNQISRLEDNLSKLQDDMRYKVQNEKDMSEKLNSLSVENGKLNEQLDALKKDLNEKTEHCQMMSLKGNEDNETMLELHGKVDFLHTQACEYENTISALKTEISLLTQSSEIKEEYEHLKEQLSQILKEKEKESVEKNDMQEKLAAALVKEATARAALTVAEKEREDHFRLANQRQVELNENTILKDKLESDLKENQLKVKKHMQELERLQSEIRLKESDNETQSFAHSKDKEVMASHLDSLKQQNNSLHFQVDELKSMLGDAKQDNVLLKGQLDMVSGECNLYKTSLDENNEEFMEMKEEKETLAKTQNEVKAQLVKVSEKLVAAESLKKELQLDLNKSHEENSELNNQVTTLQVEFQKVTADMDLLKSNYAKMLADHEIVMSECESNVIENKTLTELVDTLKTEKEELIKKMRELHNSTFVHHEEKTTKLEQNIVQEEKIEKVELQNLENKTSGSRLDIDGNIVTSVPKINEVENEQAASQIEKLQEQINELIKENVSLTEKSEADSAKFDKMLAKLKTFKERNDNYQVEVSELKQQLISSERVENSNIEHLEHKCSKLQSHLDATEEKLLSECKALQEKVVENTTLMNELSEMKARSLEYEKEAENLDREKHKMLEMLKSEKEIYSKENILLSNKLSESQNRNVELLEEIDIYRAKLTLAESGVENDKKIIESLQKQISYLQKKLESENTVSLEREETIRDLKLKVVDSDAAKCEIENQGKMAQRQLQDVKDQYEMLEQDNKTFQDVISKSAAQNTELKNENIKQKMLLEKLQAKSNAGETQYAKIKELEDELVEINNDRKYLEEEMDGLRKDIIQMKKENSKSLAEKHAYAAKIQQLTQDLESKMQEIESLKWKLDEMEGLEEELNEIKREKDLLEKDKKDLQSELLKDRSNLESLMNENEKQKFIMETQEKKLNEFNEVDNKLKETVKTNENFIDELSHQMDSQQEAAMGKIKQLEEEVEALKQEIDLCKTENISMKKQFDKANKQLQKFDILKKEYEALSEENNKLLVDKSNLAKHTEELHFKLRELSTMDQISEVDINHFDEAKKTLSNRISELEKESSDLRNRNAELSQEKSKLETNLQQAEFDRDSVHIQSSSTTDGNKYAYYQENSEKLHKQFSTAIQQKNKLQTDLNLAQRSSAQREARCQQLAMQVSQMAQDRSYLNTQLGILSKSLREKEQEIPQLQQQYRNLYQRYTALQTKVAEQDKRAILDLIQGSPAPSSGSVTPVEGHISAKTADIQNLEISMKERKTSQSSNSDVQNNIMMEPLEISMRERLGEVETHGGGDADTDDAASRIKGLQLMRQGNNSYLERIQRRLIIPSAIPPGKVDG